MIRVERDSPTWRTLRRHIDGRITELHQALEHPLDPEATATIRGQIKELRALIATVEPAAEPDPDNEIGAPVY